MIREEILNILKEKDLKQPNADATHLTSLVHYFESKVVRKGGGGGSEGEQIKTQAEILSLVHKILQSTLQHSIEPTVQSNFEKLVETTQQSVLQQVLENTLIKDSILNDDSRCNLTMILFQIFIIYIHHPANDFTIQDERGLKVSLRDKINQDIEKLRTNPTTFAVAKPVSNQVA